MTPLKAYPLDPNAHLINLEAKGEKVNYYFRWLFDAIVIIILALYYRENPINKHNVYYISFALAPAIYNTFLHYLFFIKNIYRPFIKYLSIFFDISIISTGIFISSYAFSPLYPTTAPTILVYSIVLSLCITRINSKFMIIATLYILITYNIDYFLWYKTFSGSMEYSLMINLGYTHQQHIAKTIFLIVLGVISYYTISLLKKFAIDTINATAKVKQADLMLIKQYKIILNNINIGVAIVDIKNTILFINQTLIYMLGYNKDDIIGENLLNLILPSRKNRNKNTFALFQKKLEKNRFIQFKLSLTAKSGEVIPVQFYVTKAYILNDPSYILTISDLRKQKALEERLLQSRKMETIGRMASGFAHDFNNLISIVNEYIYEVANSKKALDNDSLKKINSVINRQKELVKLLYKISGKMEESEVKLSIKSLFSKLINLFSPTISNNISLNTKSYIDEGIIFTVNETAILQIIFNLILNAKEAFESESGKIEVSTSITNNYDKANAVLLPKSYKKQKYLMVTVTDDGPGIPGNIISRIFDPYISTKSNKAGMRRGLGLSFVYAITEQLNGGISIITKRGKGTTFKIYIPTKISSKKITNNNEIARAREKIILPKQKAAILYIDDDEDMRAITSKILNKHGFKVKAVKNGIDALKLLENYNYNLILTDFYLPDIEGDKLVLKLREHCNSPIILITGAQTDNIQEIEGVHAVIKKPIEVDMLIKTISEAVKP